MPRHSASEFGQRVAILRKAQKLSQDALGEKLGLSGSAIREIERGKNYGQYAKLGDFAEVLRTTPNELLGFEPMKEPYAPAKELAEAVEMVGIGVEAILIDENICSEDQAERIVKLATQAVMEKQIHNMDRRLSVRSIAVTLARLARSPLGKR